MVYGVLSLVGRVTSGYVLNLKWATPRCYYTTVAVIGAITTSLLPLATTHVHLMVVSSAIGWACGTIVATMYVIQLQIISDFVPINRQGQTYGVCNCVFFLIAATGPPIAGIAVILLSITTFSLHVCACVCVCVRVCACVCVLYLCECRTFVRTKGTIVTTFLFAFGF